jgi:hypothetical protein
MSPPNISITAKSISWSRGNTGKRRNGVISTRPPAICNLGIARWYIVASLGAGG